MATCKDCKANKVCDHNNFGFENCNNYIPEDVAEVRRGRWLYVSGEGRYAEYECSECKAHVCFDEKIDGTIPQYKGCPYCLTKMGGGKDG